MRLRLHVRVIAAISGIYDVSLGLALLLARPLLMRVFALPAPVPPIHADLNGLLTLAIGIGYALPLRNPEAYRGYLWVMGPFLKGLGAAWFVGDVLWRASPASYLIFAVCDGALACATLYVLLATRTQREGALTDRAP